MNKSFGSLKILPILGIVLILTGYFFLTYQTFKLKERRNVLKKENHELEQLRISKTAEIKKLDSIAGIQKKIIAESADPNTVQKGEILQEKIQNITTSRFTKNKNSENNEETAERLEAEGYNYLFNRDVENAIKNFTASENAFNGYHQVYEISRFLKQNKAQLSDTKSEFWPLAYRQILQNFSWKMSGGAKEKLQTLSK